MSESPSSSQQQPAVGADRPPALRVNNIEVIYDHVILVLKGVSLEVPEGGIVALLGANGAGKTTTLKALSNLLGAERGDVTKGSIEFSGERVDRMTPNDLVRRGVIQVMEGRHCFEHLTIEENLLTGSYTRSDGRAAIQRDLDMVYGYFPQLKERRGAQAGYTSGGEQQMCAIGRALMSRPKMILLDEPSMGLAPQLVETIFETVKRLNEEEGVAFLLAEQNTNMALKYAKYGYIRPSEEGYDHVRDGVAAGPRKLSCRGVVRLEPERAAHFVARAVTRCRDQDQQILARTRIDARVCRERSFLRAAHGDGRRFAPTATASQDYRHRYCKRERSRHGILVSVVSLAPQRPNDHPVLIDQEYRTPPHVVEEEYRTLPP